MLELDGVSKAFGAVTVADDLSISLGAGEALGVIGPNGAGKTSMFNLITGTLAPDAGRIRLDGRDVTAWPAARRCRAGLARSFQVPQPFGGLTVFENALVAAQQGADMTGRASERAAYAALERTGLAHRANRPARGLGLLDRKRLELTRALAARPRVLLLDEIAGGLTDAECGSLIDTIRALHRDGMTIVWIEHVVHALLAVAERLVVIDFGRVVAAGEPRATMALDAVRAIYLGIETDG